MTKGPLVTILDDVPEIRVMLAQELEAAGFVTRSFSRAAEFERDFAALKPDLCILDWGRRRMSPISRKSNLRVGPWISISSS